MVSFENKNYKCPVLLNVIIIFNSATISRKPEKHVIIALHNIKVRLYYLEELLVI